MGCLGPWPLFPPKWSAHQGENQAPCAIYTLLGIYPSAPLWLPEALPAEWRVHPPLGPAGACAAGGLGRWFALPLSTLQWQCARTSCAES